MGKRILLILLAVFQINFLGEGAFARPLSRESMSAAELALAEELLQTDVQAELQNNTMKYLYEAAANSEDPPMSAETRRVLAKGAYRVMSSALAVHGIFISEYAFTAKVGKMLDRMASWGLFPQAFTVGYMARYQAGVGGSIGTQFNFYVEKGELKLSSYSMYGVQAGAAAQAKIQFYAGACFGSCFGGEPNGWYVGTDVSASIGAGIDGFLEFGIDFTDALHAITHGEKYTLQDMWESKAVYAGVGFDVGVGGGWALDIFHYRMDFSTTLWKESPEQNIQDINPHIMTQYQLRTQKW
jgi:hypothetical protein